MDRKKKLWKEYNSLNDRTIVEIKRLFKKMGTDTITLSGDLKRFLIRELQIGDYESLVVDKAFIINGHLFVEGYTRLSDKYITIDAIDLEFRDLMSLYNIVEVLSE